MFFLSRLHRYVSAGLQAVLELYFVRYLYVCSGSERATSLGTTSVNSYIAIYQLAAISAGFLADKIFGKKNYKWFSTMGFTSQSIFSRELFDPDIQCVFDKQWDFFVGTLHMAVQHSGTPVLL